MVLIISIVFLSFLYFLFMKDIERKTADNPMALLQDGILLINQGEVDLGLERIERSADNGLAYAAFVLVKYYLGEFSAVPANADKAMHWCFRAAQLDSQYLYLTTLPVHISPRALTPEGIMEQEKLFKPGAELGLVDHQLALARLYRWQVFLDPDASKAIYWFEKAAAQGHQEAYYNLGWLYYYDERVKDDGKAREYFEKSAACGHKDAKKILGDMLVGGSGGPKDLVRAEALLSDCAAEDEDMQTELGFRFLHGEDFAVDYVKARYWLEKGYAADPDSDYAKLAMAELMLLDPQSDDDYQQAKAVFEELAAEWYEEALYKLGKIHEQGLGGLRQPIKALMYYQLAAMSHDEIYQKAFDQLKDRLDTSEIREAQNLCDSFLHQHPIPAYNRSEHYLNQAMLINVGKHASREELQMAETLCHKSAELGNEDAMEYLVDIYRNELVDKPVQVFIWSTLVYDNYSQSGIQFLYQQQALSRLTESEISYARSQIEMIKSQMRPYWVSND